MKIFSIGEVGFPISNLVEYWLSLENEIFVTENRTNVKLEVKVRTRANNLASVELA